MIYGIHFGCIIRDRERVPQKGKHRMFEAVNRAGRTVMYGESPEEIIGKLQRKCDSTYHLRRK